MHVSVKSRNESSKGSSTDCESQTWCSCRHEISLRIYEALCQTVFTMFPSGQLITSQCRLVMEFVLYKRNCIRRIRKVWRELEPDLLQNLIKDMKNRVREIKCTGKWMSHFEKFVSTWTWGLWLTIGWRSLSTLIFARNEYLTWIENQSRGKFKFLHLESHGAMKLYI